MTRPPAPARRDRFPILLGAAVVLVLLAVGAAGLRSWQDLAKQRAREADLEAAIGRTEAEVSQLEERIGRLQDDPLTLERLARHDLGMVHPEDVVFIFPASLSGRAPAAAPTAPPASGAVAPLEPAEPEAERRTQGLPPAAPPGSTRPVTPQG
jgi:cell division protein FtsB